MFNLEHEEYKNEKVEWSQIKFEDNQHCIDLIENVKAQQPGVFKLLDDECMTKGTDPKLLKKYNEMLSGRKGFERPNKFNSNGFIIKHYAGDVEYAIEGFLEKNKDSLNEVVAENFLKSKQELLSSLFVEPTDELVA